MNSATLGITIDELAHRSGVTTRTIRAHQTARLLPPPRVLGRTAYYGPEHAERLAAIARLQARGWSRAAIRDALGAADAGRSLSELLGLPAPNMTPPAGDWVDELFATYVPPAGPRSVLPAGALGAFG